MSIPFLYQSNQSRSVSPSPPPSPLPMHHNLEEKVYEKAEWLFRDYSAEQNAYHLRETRGSDAIRYRLIEKYKQANQYESALEIALDIESLEKKLEQLNLLIDPLVNEDAFSPINRLIEAVIIEKRDAIKYKIGIAYAKRGHFIRSFETYFYISRTEWKNRFLLAVMNYIPEEQKNVFFGAILKKLLDSNEIEQAIDTVKKFSRVNKVALYRDIIKYLLDVRFLDKLSFVLNEMPRIDRAFVLEEVLKPLLLNGAISFALEIVKPLQGNLSDPSFYEETLLLMAKFMIAHQRFSDIQLIREALGGKQEELDKLIPPQPMMP